MISAPCAGFYYRNESRPPSWQRATGRFMLARRLPCVNESSFGALEAFGELFGRDFERDISIQVRVRGQRQTSHIPPLPITVVTRYAPSCVPAVRAMISQR